MAGDGGERPTCLDKGHNLAFVIAGSARHDDLAAVRQRGDARRKRRRLPKVDGIDRLHVVMAVEKDAGSAAVGPAFADHDGMPSSRPNAGFKTDAG